MQGTDNRDVSAGDALHPIVRCGLACTVARVRADAAVGLRRASCASSALRQRLKRQC